MKQLTHISLFSGIGGNDLAAEWCGFKTILQAEIDPYCRTILSQHFPGVPIIEDVKNVTRETTANSYSRFSIGTQGEIQTGRNAFSNGGSLATNSKGGQSWQSQAGNMRKDISGRSEEVEQAIANTANLQRQPGRTLEREWELAIKNQNSNSPNRLTLLTAGVPCQPASVAGKRRGKNDDRWLWPETIRVLNELQPAWAVFENPAGIISLDEFSGLSDVEGETANQIPDEYAGGLDEICGQIEQAGYEVQTVLIPACAVNAFHRRDRVFIIAHANDTGSRASRGRIDRIGQAEIQRQEYVSLNGTCGFSPTSPDADNIKQGGQRLTCNNSLPDWYGGEWRQPDPLEDNKLSPAFVEWLMGFPKGWTEPGTRVNRLKVLGNSCVPQQCQPVFKGIADIELENE